MWPLDSGGRAHHDRVRDLVVPALAPTRVIEGRGDVAGDGSQPSDERDQSTEPRDEEADDTGADTWRLAVSGLDYLHLQRHLADSCSPESYHDRLICVDADHPERREPEDPEDSETSGAAASVIVARRTSKHGGRHHHADKNDDAEDDSIEDSRDETLSHRRHLHGTLARDLDVFGDLSRNRADTHDPRRGGRRNCGRAGCAVMAGRCRATSRLGVLELIRVLELLVHIRSPCTSTRRRAST